MLNESFRLSAGASSGTVGVSWTAPDNDWVSWLFVNGRLAAEAFAPGQAERGIDIALAPGTLAVIEVHDFDHADLPDAPAAIAIPPETYTRPMIKFAAVAGAARYRLYHRPEAGIETRVWEATANPDDGDWIELDCPVELTAPPAASRQPQAIGSWHFFRVEAVSAYGIESLAQAWAWRSLDVPTAPRVSVASGAEPGTWTFTVN